MPFTRNFPRVVSTRAKHVEGLKLLGKVDGRSVGEEKLGWNT